MRIPALYLSSAEMASVSAWSPSVVTSDVVATVDSRYVLLTPCAIGMVLVLLPWLGFVYQLAEKPG
jgi:Trk-type K+ transport system membrane component